MAVPMLEALVREFVCGGSAACGAALGSPETQSRVLGTFLDLSRAFDLSHGQGLVLRALLAGDPYLARDLAAALGGYNADLTALGVLAGRVPDLLGAAPPGV